MQLLASKIILATTDFNISFNDKVLIARQYLQILSSFPIFAITSFD